MGPTSFSETPSNNVDLPAFEPANPSDLPLTKDASLAGRVRVVQADKSACAHEGTQSHRWFGDASFYEVNFEFCYEPYFVGPSRMPRFDERFASYGGDKSSHALEMYEAGFKFVVAPEAFIIHKPHAPGNWRSAYNWTRAWMNVMGLTTLLDQKYHLDQLHTRSECIEQGVVEAVEI
eukprot:CAMPEP_0175900056 /NCGR_PEP_ID=MMETSP0108-20121206/2132_1 /TAXON_ID=195067 ORGANISM="Goniomonas pacifica, Strain CCMP1869" /NCGR_SAMPLE_ID=MMETSP0108 /ASSEMBLY_ACC=CAM_ASM_000204 /LENGTH=176 /DNA_ID=CAMNT_0017221561 /DNA_START=152 /DNA_END=683 /DNA_ORIENTATION=+